MRKHSWQRCDRPHATARPCRPARGGAAPESAASAAGALAVERPTLENRAERARRCPCCPARCSDRLLLERLRKSRSVQELRMLEEWDACCDSAGASTPGVGAAPDSRWGADRKPPGTAPAAGTPLDDAGGRGICAPRRDVRKQSASQRARTPGMRTLLTGSAHMAHSRPQPQQTRDILAYNKPQPARAQGAPAAHRGR